VGSRAEGLPKSGALLQGAENGGAYACAKGMDGEKNYYSPPPTALSFCVSHVYNYILRSIAAVIVTTAAVRRILISTVYQRTTLPHAQPPIAHQTEP
jgi:hypothetical protein